MMTLALAALIIAALLLCLAAATLTITKTVGSIVNVSDTTVAADETIAIATPTVPVAHTGVLTTHTTNTTGSITMDASGHGITTGSRIDIYWDGGQCYGAVVGTVSGNVVPIASVSGGNNLPSSSTVITVASPVSAPFAFVGDNATAIVIYSPVRGYVVIADGSGDLYAKYLTAGKAGIWDSSDLTTNPVAGDTPTQAWFSHADTGVAQTDMKAVALYHN